MLALSGLFSINQSWAFRPKLGVSPKAPLVADVQACANSINRRIVFSAPTKASDRTSTDRRSVAPTTYIGLLRIKPFAEINRAVRMGGRLAWISSGSPGALHTFRGPASPNPKLEFTIHDPTCIEDGDETGHLHTGFCVVCKVGFYVEVNVVTTIRPLVIMWQAIKQKEIMRDGTLIFT